MTPQETSNDMHNNLLFLSFGRRIPNDDLSTKTGSEVRRFIISAIIILVIEVLNRKLQNVVEKGSLDLFQLYGVNVVSHLSYADDIIFLCRANIRSFIKLKEILKDFTDFMGLDINDNKLFVVFSIGTQGQSDLQRILGFPTKQLPISHLGASITGHAIKDGDCLNLITALQGFLNK